MKQGCLLSPILFDLVIEIVIQAMEGVPDAGYPIAHSVVKTLSYADDLCVLATSPATIQQMLTRAQEAAKWAGLTFNPRKCASLSIFRRGGKRQRVDKIQPSVENVPIPALPWEGSYKYLGCRRGADPKADLSQAATDYLADCEAILGSDLTDWQKLDAVQRFAKPRLIYLLQNMEPSISWARAIDRTTKSLVKQHFKLPRRTVSSFLYSPTKAGGLGLPNIEDEIHLFRASTAFKVLFAQDALISDIAASALAKTAEIRSNHQKTAQVFINSPPDPGEGKRGDITSLWSEVRTSLQHCGAEIHMDNKSISCGDTSLSWYKRKFLSSLLRDSVQHRYLEKWKQHSDQGRATICTSAHPASNHWVTTGNYTSFGEYRFALKARLNLLPTRTS